MPQGRVTEVALELDSMWAGMAQRGQRVRTSALGKEAVTWTEPEKGQPVTPLTVLMQIRYIIRTTEAQGFSSGVLPPPAIEF